MDDATKDGVLASMALRRVGAMRRRLYEDIVKVYFEATGELPTDAADVRRKFDLLWVEPTPQRVDDMVAAKCASSIEYHDGELDRASELIDRATFHDDRRKLEGACVAAVYDEDQVGMIEYARAVAVELAAHAPGDPAKSPPSLMAQRIIPQEVADYVDTLMTAGG